LGRAPGAAGSCPAPGARTGVRGLLENPAGPHQRVALLGRGGRLFLAFVIPAPCTIHDIEGTNKYHIYPKTKYSQLPMTSCSSLGGPARVSGWKPGGDESPPTGRGLSGGGHSPHCTGPTRCYLGPGGREKLPGGGDWVGWACCQLPGACWYMLLPPCSWPCWPARWGGCPCGWNSRGGKPGACWAGCSSGAGPPSHLELGAGQTKLLGVGSKLAGLRQETDSGKPFNLNGHLNSATLRCQVPSVTCCCCCCC
jgi:hypothetical protein